MGEDWLNALEAAGGRLVPAARVFIDAQAPSTLAPGTAGIRWLADTLEDFVDRDTDSMDDDRFVEGAGALLGLLLIEHLGGRAYERDGCHRIQLGRFGWFDPFHTIQEALDAEEPRRCLADYLAMAEREAAQDGPVSRALRAFAERLARDRPDLDIASHFELTVDLSNGATVDLERLARVTREQETTAASEAAGRIISMLPGSASREVTPWKEAASRLLPRLVSERFLSSLPAEQKLYAVSLGNDVYVTLQLRYGSRSRYVRRDEVEAWALERDAARQHAIDNLVNQSQALRLEPIGDRLLRIRRGDGLDGARLLLPDLAARLASVDGAPWVAAAPHRDILLVACGSALEELFERAEDAVRRAPHPVSASLFAITPQGPRPLPR